MILASGGVAVIMSSFMTYTIAVLSGNYLYQWLQQEPDYLVALDRSYFMVGAALVALAVLFLLGLDIKIIKRGN